MIESIFLIVLGLVLAFLGVNIFLDSGDTLNHPWVSPLTLKEKTLLHVCRGVGIFIFLCSLGNIAYVIIKWSQ